MMRLGKLERLRLKTKGRGDGEGRQYTSLLTTALHTFTSPFCFLQLTTTI